MKKKASQMLMRALMSAHAQSLLSCLFLGGQEVFSDITLRCSIAFHKLRNAVALPMRIRPPNGLQVRLLSSVERHSLELF
jgi:hypothetical protein